MTVCEELNKYFLSYVGLVWEKYTFSSILYFSSFSSQHLMQCHKVFLFFSTLYKITVQLQNILFFPSYRSHSQSLCLFALYYALFIHLFFIFIFFRSFFIIYIIILHCNGINSAMNVLKAYLFTPHIIFRVNILLILEKIFLHINYFLYSDKLTFTFFLLF